MAEHGARQLTARGGVAQRPRRHAGVGAEQELHVVSAALKTQHGVKFTPPLLIRAAQTLGANAWTMLFLVILPAALPNIMTGARIGLGLAWVCVVISELLGVTAWGLAS